MASIRYRIHSTAEAAPIYLRLSLGRGKYFQRKTGLFINSKEWSKSAGLPKQTYPSNKNLATDLGELKMDIFKKVNKASSNGIQIDGEWLSYNIDLYFKRISESNQNDLVVEFVQQIIDNANTKVLKGGKIGLSKNRVKGYVTFKGVIEKFELYSQNRIKFENIDIKFEEGFKTWLLRKQGFSINYAGKNIDNLKAVCNEAKRMGVNVNSHFSDIKTFSQSKEDRRVITLSLDELDRIEQLDNLSKSLNNVRKWLLIGCEIGQRGGDLLRLTEKNFRLNENGIQFIDVIQQKTRKQISIPVSSKVKRVIHDGFPHSISMQKFNSNLKDLCELAEIDTPTKGTIMDKGMKRKINKLYPKHRLISSHVCRRSFATNYYKKISTPVLMEITGHSKESLFLTYIGKSKDKDENALILLDRVEKIENDRIEAKKSKSKMSVIKTAN